MSKNNNQKSVWKATIDRLPGVVALYIIAYTRDFVDGVLDELKKQEPGKYKPFNIIEKLPPGKKLELLEDHVEIYAEDDEDDHHQANARTDENGENILSYYRHV